MLRGPYLLLFILYVSLNQVLSKIQVFFVFLINFTTRKVPKWVYIQEGEIYGNLDVTDSEVLRRDLLYESSDIPSAGFSNLEMYLDGPYDMQYSRREKYNIDSATSGLKTQTSSSKPVPHVCAGPIRTLPSGDRICYIASIQLPWAQAEQYCKDIGMDGLAEARNEPDNAYLALLDAIHCSVLPETDEIKKPAENLCLRSWLGGKQREYRTPRG